MATMSHKASNKFGCIFIFIRKRIRLWTAYQWFQGHLIHFSNQISKFFRFAKRETFWFGCYLRNRATSNPPNQCSYSSPVLPRAPRWSAFSDNPRSLPWQSHSEFHSSLGWWNLDADARTPHLHWLRIDRDPTIWSSVALSHCAVSSGCLLLTKWNQEKMISTNLHNQWY